jgi:3-(3-hydroxy-phenyl)propionate hydroxylase
MEPTVDVVIVGAGPTGLTLASDLHRWGVSFRIIDKKAAPEPFSKAANFWPRTQEVTTAIGFGQRIIAAGVPIRGQTLVAFGKVIGHPQPGPYPSPFPTVLDIGQDRIEHTIQHYLSEHGHRVEYHTALVALEHHPASITMTLEYADGRHERVHSRYLVACDGSRSAVRAMTGLHIQPILLPQRAYWQIDARLRWSRQLTHDHIWFFLFDDGFCGIVPLPDARYRVFILRDEHALPDREPSLAEMQAAVQAIANDPVVELSDPIWYSHGRLRYGVAPTFHQGHVLFAGDAGHITIPIGGQGMNTGIQDAFNLGWKLAAVVQGRATPTVLDSYSLERRPVRQALADDQAANFRRLTQPSLVQKLATRWLGPIVMRGGRSIELGRRDEAQLTINYPHSPLSEDHLRDGRVRAGDRAPDAVIVAVPAFRTTTLFAHIYRRTWTLLGFDGAGTTEDAGRLGRVLRGVTRAFGDIEAHLVLAAADAPKWAHAVAGGGALLDRDGRAHAAYDIKRPTLVLVRPDGHVGFRGGLAHTEALHAYCQRVFLPCPGVADAARSAKILPR